eukprot:552127-Pyramimonas_sp.AAC.1
MLQNLRKHNPTTNPSAFWTTEFAAYLRYAGRAKGSASKIIYNTSIWGGGELSHPTAHNSDRARLLLAPLTVHVRDVLRGVF